MGRTMRWLKGLFGMKRDRDRDFKDKKGSSFGRDSGGCGGGLCHNPATIPPNLSAAEAAWLRSYYAETEQERQSKHAIAVAAATAAAADAAVAAAHAAVAVVRLTSHGRGTMLGGGGGGTARERGASVKIQTVFRGYLARKALRALKGLVKLQAVVRGYLVRKQATATLHSMQALIRAQATVRSHKTRALLLNNHLNSDPHARKSMSNLQQRSFDHNDISNNNSNSVPISHSRRLSASLDASFGASEEVPKIVEVDTGRPKSRSSSSRRTTSTAWEDYGAHQAVSSPLPCSRRTHTASVGPAEHSPSEDQYDYPYYWGLTGDECRFSTAQSTPRFGHSCGAHTPAKSVCAAGDGGYYGDFPSYMANTQSFKAKLRSYSAPKQRPEPAPKKRLSLTELMESRSSLSGVRMQRSCSQVQEAISFKNVVMGKLEYRDRIV